MCCTLYRFIEKDSIGSGIKIINSFLFIYYKQVTNQFQVIWVLKMRALTMQVYVDDIEGEEEGIADTLLDNYTIATMPRPGTSLKNPGTSHTEQGFRPKTQSGRPVTGVVRPATQSALSQTFEQALRTPRTAMTARPITASTGRSVR